MKVKKKDIENPSATATKTGVDAGGVDSRVLGAFVGSTLRLYAGERAGLVQLTLALFVTREHEPNNPKKRLGPSTFPPLCSIRDVDGVTVNNATRSCNIITGERNVNTERRIAVSARMGET